MAMTQNLRLRPVIGFRQPPERPEQSLKQVLAIRTLAELEGMFGIRLVSAGSRHVGRCPDADHQDRPALLNSGVWPNDGSN